MLYLIADQLGFPGVLNLIRYISFRAGAASATALLIGLLLGPKFISWLRATQGKGQPIREDGPRSHLSKRGTPTMGGLLILISLSISVLLWMNFASTYPYVWACLLVTVGFGVIGWLDDYDKVKKAHHAGLPGKVRLALEFLIAGIATWLMVRSSGTGLHLPFVKETVVDLGWFYVAFGAFVIVAFGNAVNLTDGLDGLATMPVVIASIAFLVISYLVGNVKFADYLGIPHVPGQATSPYCCSPSSAPALPSYGSTPRQRRFSWATRVVSRSAVRWEPCRSLRTTSLLSLSSAESSSSKRCR